MISKYKVKNIDFVKKCFELSLKILKTGVTNKFINGPINKETFLRKSYPGITEYIARKTKTKEYAMLYTIKIYQFVL